MKVLNLPSVNISDDVLWQVPSLTFQVLGESLRGEPDIGRLRAAASDYLAVRDLMYTLSVMCSPDDLVQVSRFDEALGSEELFSAMQGLSKGAQYGIWSQMDAATALSIADREPVQDIIQRLTSRDWVAHFACGYILRRIVSLHQHIETRGTASLNEAATTVERFCHANRIVGGGRRHVIHRLWRKYRSVSHFWAAWSIIQDSGYGEKAIPEWFPMFCGTAQWLLEQGVAITPKKGRKGQTILNSAEAWTLPASRVPRSPDGTILNRVWNDDPDAHDIRKKSRPPAREGG